MTDGKARAAEPSLFQGLANSAAREATRGATQVASTIVTIPYGTGLEAQRN